MRERVSASERKTRAIRVRRRELGDASFAPRGRTGIVESFKGRGEAISARSGGVDESDDADTATRQGGNCPMIIARASVYPAGRFVRKMGARLMEVPRERALIYQ